MNVSPNSEETKEREEGKAKKPRLTARTGLASAHTSQTLERTKKKTLDLWGEGRRGGGDQRRKRDRVRLLSGGW